MKVFRVLFVCTGNTCRSPMAEMLLRSRLEKEAAQSEVQVGSAGISAWPGQPASPEAIAVMTRRGLASIVFHRSRQVDAALLQEADLVLTMTRFHRDFLRKHFADQAAKVFLLNEYAGVGGEVADPAGGPLTGYQACAGELEHILRISLEKILFLAGKKTGDGENKPDMQGGEQA